MGLVVFEECSWCSGNSLRRNKKDLQAEHLIRLLLSLLDLSPSVAAGEQDFHLCSNCIDLVYAGVDYKKRLDEIKVTLENRAAVKVSKCRTTKSAKDGSPKKLGQRIAKCFLNCTVQLESINLDEVTSPNVIRILGASDAIQQPTVELATESAKQEELGHEFELDIQVKVEEQLAELVNDENNEKSQFGRNEGSMLEDGWIEIQADDPLVPEHVSSEVNQRDIEILAGENEHELVNQLKDQDEPGQRKKNLNQNSCADREQEPSNFASSSTHENEVPSDYNGSDEDFCVHQLSSDEDNSDGVDDSDPGFHPQNSGPESSGQAEQPTRRQTRAALAAARNCGLAISQLTELPPEKSFSSSEKRNNGNLLPKTAGVNPSMPVSRQRRSFSINVRKKMLLSKPSLVARKKLQNSIYTTYLLTKTTVTRNQCLFCTECVPETTLHLARCHNLERQYGNYYSCRFCLQAYQPPDPATRTGLLTMKDIDNFKEFVKQHASCSVKLKKAKKTQMCRSCKTRFRSGPDCISHEYMNHAEKIKILKVLACALCPGKKFRLSEITGHINSTHPSNKQRLERLWGCANCPAAFTSEGAAYLHRIQHIFSKFSSFDVCVLCKSHRDSVVSLYGHYYSKHGLDFINFSHFACVNCNEAFQSTSDERLPSGKASRVNRIELKEFAKAHSACVASALNSVEQKCRFCSFTTMKAEQLISHEYSKHPQETSANLKQRCKVCHLPCDDLQLVEHMFRHSPSDVNLFKWTTEVSQAGLLLDYSKCTKCPVELTRSDEFVAHHNLHAIDDKSHVSELEQLNLPKKKCCLCEFVYRKKREPMASHYEEKHNMTQFLFDCNTYFKCRTCYSPFVPSQSDKPLGQVTIDDVEDFKAFAIEHFSCTKEAATSYSCRQCSTKTSKTFGDLVVHQTKEHFVPLKCQYCSTSCSSNQRFKKHVLKDHSQKLLIENKCYRCFKQFGSLDQLQKHIAENVAEPQSSLLLAGFNCLACDLFFDTTALLALHIQEIHQNRSELIYSCPRCITELKSNDFKSLYCQTCTGACLHLYGLQIHGREHNYRTFTALCTHHHQDCITRIIVEPCAEVANFDLRCFACDDTSSTTLQDFAVHLNSHVGFETAFRCPCCTDISPSETAQQDHLRTKHNLRNPVPTLYCCYTCKEDWKSAIKDSDSQELRYNDSLKFLRFAESHANCEKQPLTSFKCHTCSYSAANPETAYRHELDRHSKKYDLHCYPCGQSFPTEAELELHLKEGEGIPSKEHHGPWEGPRKLGARIPSQLQTAEIRCHRCWQTFDKTEQLKEHLVESTADEGQVQSLLAFAGFSCLSCTLSFNSTALLSLHIQEFHDTSEEVTFNCRRCTQIFESRDFRRSGAYILDLQAETRSFETFTALCAYHHQNCMAQKSAEPCTSEMDSDLCCYCYDCKDLAWSTLQEFAVHLNTHLGFETAVKCPACTHISPCKATHREHVSYAHKLNSTMTNYYHCSKCDEPWNSKIGKRGHGEVFQEDTFDFLEFAELHAKCDNQPLTKFKCKFCDKEAETPHQLYSHEIRKHTRNYPFRCDRCDEGFLTRAKLQSHSKMEEMYLNKLSSAKDLDKRQYKCRVCGIIYASFHYLKKHEETHKQVETETELDSIEPEQFNFRPHICSDCGRGFKSLLSLDAHYKCIHEEGPNVDKLRCVCHVCGEMMAARSLKAHKCAGAGEPKRKKRTRKAPENDGAAEGEPSKKKPCQTSSKGSHLCFECGKVFDRSNLLKYHMNSHTGGRPFKCKQCDKAFPSPQFLNKHKNRVHRDKLQKGTFPCPHCGKLFFRDLDVTSHIRNTHNNEIWGGPPICSICGKVFKHAPLLKLHMNSHTGDRPFKCTECDKSFKRPQTLENHKKLHRENRERNIPCPHCDKMFFRKANVDQHVRVFHNKLPWPSKIKSYKKWIPKNPEALAAAGIDYTRKVEKQSETETGSEDEETGESDSS